MTEGSAEQSLSAGRTEDLGSGVLSVTAENPGPLTLDGTRTWIVGTAVVAIVDPGPDDPAHLDRVARAVNGRDVAAVCLTHAHIDHSAASASAVERWGRLYASAETLARIGVDGTPLRDGDEIVLDERAGGLVLHALETPGHSGDHLAFMLLPTRDVLTGDLVLGRGSSMVAHPDGSVGAYLASLARLGSLRPRRLLPGHGPVVGDAAARLAEYAAHRRERSSQVQAALEAGARSVSELRDAVYGDIPPGVVQAAELSLLAHLEHLEELGYRAPWPSDRSGDRR
ncbi:MAG: MBL fold metallo-hydrolase [Gemmatimonadota bacterium]|nr:MBL fold metallo-hydrolase [Gemmatimonadota bacterium]